MLAPFRVRSFRFQWPADLLTSWAFEMETIILGWYVLVETKSVVWLTLFGASQYLGTLIAPLYGVAGDRFGHKSLLLAMRLSYAVFASALLAFILSGHISPLVVIAVTLMMGLVRPSDIGVRGALIAESMPADTLVSGLSMSRTTQDSARVVGALAGASIVALFGMAPAYMIIAGFYIVGALLMFGDTEPVRHITMAMTPEELEGKSPWRDLKEGLAHTWNTPILLALVSLAFLTNLSAFPLTMGLMPYVARDVYHVDQTWLGYLLCGRRPHRLTPAQPCQLCNSAHSLDDGLLVALVRHARRLCADADPDGGASVPDPCGRGAEFLHDLAADHVVARGGRALPRPGDGRAHDGDLQPADRVAGRRSADRRHGLSRNGDALCADRARLHGAHLVALARRPVAGLSCCR
jgi:hypothetical protein